MSLSHWLVWASQQRGFPEFLAIHWVSELLLNSARTV
jgi:hypothetical protein